MYVTDLSDTVTIINTSTNQIVGKINPPLAAGFVGVAVSPDGNTVYLANGNHTITVVKSPTNHPTFGMIRLDESLTPFGVVVTPDGKTLYVANAGSNTVSVIDTATQSVASLDIMCNENCSSTPPIAVTPAHAGTTAVNVYVGTLDGFTVIDTATQSVQEFVMTTCGPSPCAAQGISASGDGATVFVSQFEVDRVLGIDVSLMNLIDDLAMVGNSPIGLSVTPDRNSVYVANMNGNSVSVIDVGSCGPVCTVSQIATGIIAQPNIVGVTPDGSKVYVGGNANSMSVIDTATNMVAATVQNLASGPVGIAIGPGDSAPGTPGPQGMGGGSGCAIASANAAADSWLPYLLIPVIATRALRRRVASSPPVPDSHS